MTTNTLYLDPKSYISHDGANEFHPSPAHPWEVAVIRGMDEIPLYYATSKEVAYKIMDYFEFRCVKCVLSEHIFS